jgi:hypothetical protein
MRCLGLFTIWCKPDSTQTPHRDVNGPGGLPSARSEFWNCAPASAGGILCQHSVGQSLTTHPKLLIPVALLSVMAVLSPSEAIAGPPFLTDDPEPVPYQHFEFYNLSLGTAIRSDTAGEGPAWEYNYGIIPNGQIHIIAPLAFDAPAGGRATYGLGDTELGFKYRIIDEDKNGARPMIGVYPLVELPTGDEARSLGAGYVRAYFPVWLQKSFGDWTSYGGGGYWINQGDDTANRNYWFFGWLVQKQVTKQLAIGGEIFHQSSVVAFGATSPIYTQPTTGFNIGAIYDFDDNHHLLVSIGTGLQNASTTNVFSWYLAYQITGPGPFMGDNGPGFLPLHR